DCETIWARIEGFANGESTGCYEVVSFEICTGGINVGELDDLEACYDEVAENAFFDLTQNDENALDGLSNENYSVSYFTDEDDASANTDPIANPDNYEHNTDQTTTIYVRIEDNDDSNCYDVGQFEISTYSSGYPHQPNDLEVCFENAGDDLIYDLTQVIDEVLDGQDPDEFDISFYETENEATNDNGAIEDPEDYLAQNENQTIWVRIQNAEHPECFNLTSFDLLTTTVTIGEDIENLEACDGGDGGLFNLTDAQSDILDGQSPLEYNTTYYENADDAEDGINPIENPEAYENQTNPQTIYVRIEA